jgi:putative acetyltransferase
MPMITPLRPEHAEEARHLIYTVAHDLFHPHELLEETIARYETSWPLKDVLAFEKHYIHQDGTFLVMVEGDRIIATGALHRLEGSVGEIKRVWLKTNYHGQGYGYQMMAALLDAARRFGYAKVRLETAPAYQPRAVAFYQRLGFVEIPRYGDDPDDIGMELAL